MHEFLLDPLLALHLAWLASRLQVWGEVRGRVGQTFSMPAYLIGRWPQIASGYVFTLLAYALLASQDMLTFETALGAGIAADQMIERSAGLVARSRRRQVQPDDVPAPGDITTIATEYRARQEGKGQ